MCEPTEPHRPFTEFQSVYRIWRSTKQLTYWQQKQRFRQNYNQQLTNHSYTSTEILDLSSFLFIKSLVEIDVSLDS